MTTLAKWVNSTRTDRAFTDLYDTVGEGGYPVEEGLNQLIARPVAGGHFSLLALWRAGGLDRTAGTGMGMGTVRVSSKIASSSLSSSTTTTTPTSTLGVSMMTVTMSRTSAADSQARGTSVMGTVAGSSLVSAGGASSSIKAEE